MVTNSLLSLSLSFSLSLSLDIDSSSGAVGPDVSATPPSELTALSPPTKTPTKRNRCHVCRKKVGLTGEKEKGGREREGEERRGEERRGEERWVVYITHRH